MGAVRGEYAALRCPPIVSEKVGMEVSPLPTPVKTANNMSKHLTKAEREAREAQESRVGFGGSRSSAGDPGPGAFGSSGNPGIKASGSSERKIKRPKLLKDDKAAAANWTRILKTMEGLDILDALDADTLGIYCAKLARRDELQEIYMQRRKAYAEEQDRAQLKDMLALNEDLRAIERELLNYAGKLGLTPESRARLARRMAEQEDGDPDADLFA